MATIRILCGLICFAFISRSGLFDRSIIRKEKKDYEKIIRNARNQIGVREATGKNDGKDVEKYLDYVGFKKGPAWCAAFVSWTFWKAGHNKPKTAWSPALFPTSRLVKNAQPGTVFGIYFADLKRIGHCGIVECLQGDWIQSIEGNTNPVGSREGQGVYRKLRHKRTISKYADWL